MIWRYPCLLPNWESQVLISLIMVILTDVEATNMDFIMIIIIIIVRRYNEETKFSVTRSFVLTHSSDSILIKILSDECVSTKLGVTENFVFLLYLLIQSSTLKKCIEHCLMALATLLHVIIIVIIIIIIIIK